MNTKNFMSESEIQEEWPWFIREEYVRDKNQRRPSDKNYDPTSLYIPPNEWEKMSGVMQQYWQIKSVHFEKILFFKLGKFYEIFYDDAIICHKLLDLAWMCNNFKKKQKLHVGFPEKTLEKYVEILVNNGYKIAVVEQTKK